MTDGHMHLQDTGQGVTSHIFVWKMCQATIIFFFPQSRACTFFYMVQLFISNQVRAE